MRPPAHLGLVEVQKAGQLAVGLALAQHSCSTAPWSAGSVSIRLIRHRRVLAVERYRAAPRELRARHSAGPDLRRPLRPRGPRGRRRARPRARPGARRDQAGDGPRARRRVRVDRRVDHLARDRARRDPRGPDRPGPVEPDELPAPDHRGHDPRRGAPSPPRPDDLGVGGRDHRRPRPPLRARADDDRRARRRPGRLRRRPEHGIGVVAERGGGEQVAEARARA